jgi:hypothetical protein
MTRLLLVGALAGLGSEQTSEWMLPLFTVLRVVKVFPQVQVTWVSVYSGWVFFFMVSSRGLGRRVVPHGVLAHYVC